MTVRTLDAKTIKTLLTANSYELAGEKDMVPACF